MTQHRRLLLLAPVATVAVVIALVAGLGKTSLAQSTADPPVPANNAEPASQTASISRPCLPGGATRFGFYYLGESFQGLPLTDRVRLCEPPPPTVRNASGVVVHAKPTRLNLVSYVYGSCEPAPTSSPSEESGGCTPPLQVVSWPACERPHSLLERYSGPPGVPPYPHKDSAVRDVKAAIFDDGHRIELYTGDTTVVVTGRSQSMVSDATQTLVRAPGSPNGASNAQDPLPPAANAATAESARGNPAC